MLEPNLTVSFQKAVRFLGEGGKFRGGINSRGKSQGAPSVLIPEIDDMDDLYCLLIDC